MPAPPRFDELARQLGDVYRQAEAEINAQLSAALREPSAGNARRRLRALLREIETHQAHLETEARRWINGNLPSAWEAGGVAAHVGQFSWTQPHSQGVGLLAQDTFSEILQATSYMDRDVKALVRDLGSQRVQQKVVQGTPAKAAGRDLAERLDRTGITALTYRDGRNVRASSYAEMLMRTKSAVAYNAGGLNQMLGAGVRYVEGIDGADCGLVTHDDGNKVNGKIFPVDVAAAYSISHPNCRRDWAPRPDIVDDSQAAVATSWRDPDQISDQTNFEKYLRGEVPSPSRVDRSPRTPRTPRSSPRTPRTPRS